jgi:putative membrane protein
MTSLRNAAVLAVAGALAFAGCSKGEKSEGETAGPSVVSHGGESEEARKQPAEPGYGEPGFIEEEYVEETIEPAPETRGAKAAADPKAPGALNDGEIAKITEVLNSGEVQQGELARTRANDPNVQLFAAQMVTDHGQAKQAGAKIVMQERLVPEESAIATELAVGAQSALQSLQTSDSANFDRNYMSAQVRQHQQALSLIDSQLLPSVESPALKAELEKARALVQRHLDHAKQIQAALGAVP